MFPFYFFKIKSFSNLNSMASSSKKLAKIISRIASQFYFLIIIFQVPLFRFPCSVGICTNPVELTSSQLIFADVLPTVIPKALLYPGSFAKAIINGRPVPSYDKFLTTTEFAMFKESPAAIDLQHVEVLAGSFLSVAGAVLGLVISRRTSLLGLLLILWGIGKEVVIEPHVIKDTSKVAIVYSTMFIAMLSAFLSVRGDVRKLIHAFKLDCFPNLVRSNLKPKYQ